uniref:Fido domain-containing protein n=1 Tax=Prevotella sp. GTC17260 TaxID=3236796 RepID=A0AB33JCL4_9BACT
MCEGEDTSGFPYGRNLEQKSVHSLEDIIDFHKHFKAIHPFQDGDGRVGRLIMFKGCLALNIAPFIIAADFKMFDYRGLQNWPKNPGCLLDISLVVQDNNKDMMECFGVKKLIC